MIDYAEINLYDENDNQIGFELSATQFVAVCKLLGIQYNGKNEITCYSDETIQRLCEMKGNPLRMELVE